MDEKIKLLAHKIVNKIDNTVKKATKENFFKMGKTVDIGADGTPTKYIDKIAEDVAVEIIKKSKFKVNLLSEEIGFIDNGGNYIFVLDPVDGTRNAYRGIPFFSVSLAVGKSASTLKDIEYGIVKNIPTGDVFIAQKNHGAFLNNNRIGVSDVPPKKTLSSLVLGVNCDHNTILLCKQNYIRSLGSASLEMCMVASGALDLYYVGKEFMRVVDIAAATLIVREAGGVVKNIYGKDLDMKISLDVRTSVIAAGSENSIPDITFRHKK